MSPEEIEKQAVIIREFINHPGMQLLTERVNKKIDLKRSEWLNAKTTEEAEVIRQEGRVYGALMGLLNEFILRGAQASQRKSTGEVR